MDHVVIKCEPLHLEAVSSLVSHSSDGAISIFAGTTRDNFGNKAVTKLVYEGYESMAKSELYKICREIRTKWNVHNVAIEHRLGEVPIGEASVIIAISSEHRRDSLEALTFAIDTLKATVPIWKKEFYADGTCNWKENKECCWKSSEDYT